MKIVLQSLKQIKYEVDITDYCSVLDLKKLVESKHGFDHSVLKLLHKGKILEDQKLLSEYCLNDGTPIIIMNVKAKATNVSVATVNNTQVKSNEEVKTHEVQINATKSQPKTIIPPNEYINELKQLQEMGFDKVQSENALRATKGNLPYAIEILYSGNQINNLQDEDEEDQDYVMGGEYEEGEDEEDDMEEDNEAFEIEDIASVIKVISQNDTSQLQNILSNMASHNPELLEIIQENEAEFKILVAQPITPKDQQVYENFIKRNNGNIYGINSNLPSTNAIPNNLNNNSILPNNLSEQENEAIQRLKSLGFSEEECIEAYFACGKNENMAACYLFDNK